MSYSELLAKTAAAANTPAASTNDSNTNARVRVVVRIRPLSAKEDKANHKNILEGGEHHIRAWDPTCLEQNARADLAILDASCWSREFAFDRCLWSTDAHSDSYASQSDVFDEVGQPVLDWILGGYNCCVFAFGQTGAGKTWTMMGDIKSSDPSRYGLIPRICFSLFEALDANSTGEGLESVMFSHMEIYNENVRDLLARPATNSSNGMPMTEYLRVREHPTRGVFVANLTTIRVTNFEDMMSLIAIGDKNRTVGATNANAHSSRSHAIVTLTVIQRSRSAPKNGLPTSALQQRVGRVHLVDLAGSERVYMTGAQGTRLREASNINRSLSVLGDVIKCLGDLKGSGVGGKKGHVPYRNSTLTMVLKDSLGGNAHAVMLTAVSPSSFDYEETVSTLKYADRAKRVRMRVEANVTSGLLATDASAVELVPLLQAEVRHLREMLAAQQHEQQQVTRLGRHTVESNSGPYSGSGSGLSGEVEEMRERVRELETQLAERERLIASLDMVRRGTEETYEDDEDEDEEEEEDEEGQPLRNGGDADLYYHIEARTVWDDPVDEGDEGDGHYQHRPPRYQSQGQGHGQSQSYGHSRGQAQGNGQRRPEKPYSIRATSQYSSNHSNSHTSSHTTPALASVPVPVPADIRKSIVQSAGSPLRRSSTSSASSSSTSARNGPVVVLSEDVSPPLLPPLFSVPPLAGALSVIGMPPVASQLHVIVCFVCMACFPLLLVLIPSFVLAPSLYHRAPFRGVVVVMSLSCCRCRVVYHMPRPWTCRCPE